MAFPARPGGYRRSGSDAGDGGLDQERAGQTEKHQDAAGLRERALRLLARRDHARSELTRKLAPHAESIELLDALLDDLVALGLLSDQRFAEQRSTARGKRLGNSRLAHELRTKGVEDAIIASALDGLGDEMTRAREVWHKKFRGNPPGNREEWARQARFLQSRGFPSDLIRKLLDDPEHLRPDDCND